MSKTTRTVCDHCGDVITIGGSVVEVTAGELRQRTTETWDVCQSCSQLLVEFFAGRRKARPDESP
jgi:hypothetical protein